MASAAERRTVFTPTWLIETPVQEETDEVSTKVVFLLEHTLSFPEIFLIFSIHPELHLVLVVRL